MFFSRVSTIGDIHHLRAWTTLRGREDGVPDRIHRDQIVDAAETRLADADVDRLDLARAPFLDLHAQCEQAGALSAVDYRVERDLSGGRVGDSL